MAKITIKLCTAHLGDRKNRCLDLSKLANPRIKQQLNLELNKFSIVQVKTALSIDNFNTTQKEAREKILGYRKSKKAE